MTTSRAAYLWKLVKRSSVRPLGITQIVALLVLIGGGLWSHFNPEANVTVQLMMWLVPACCLLLFLIAGFITGSYDMHRDLEVANNEKIAELNQTIEDLSQGTQSQLAPSHPGSKIDYVRNALERYASDLEDAVANQDADKSRATGKKAHVLISEALHKNNKSSGLGMSVLSPLDSGSNATSLNAAVTAAGKLRSLAGQVDEDDLPKSST